MQPAPPHRTPAAGYTNTVRIGYARVSGRAQDHQMQLDALVAADCREVIIETASTRATGPNSKRSWTPSSPATPWSSTSPTGSPGR
jgi:hypothetical protein